jgi:hypothetical protein
MYKLIHVIEVEPGVHILEIRTKCEHDVVGLEHLLVHIDLLQEQLHF